MHQEAYLYQNKTFKFMGKAIVVHQTACEGTPTRLVGYRPRNDWTLECTSTILYTASHLGNKC